MKMYPFGAKDAPVLLLLPGTLLPLEKQFWCGDSTSGRQFPGAVCQLRWL